MISAGAMSKEAEDWRLQLAAVLEPQWQVACFEEVASTMDAARELLKNRGAGKPLIVLAREQSHGRGRQGRQWRSTEGALYCSTVFTTKAALPALQAWTLVVGCVLQRVLAGLGAAVRLKWPNDILSTDKRKLAGVLVESVGQGAERHVITGIGMNLCQVPADLPGTASLAGISGRKSSPAEIALQTAPALLEGWTSFLSSGFQVFREEWMNSASGLGEPVRVNCAGEVISGTMTGIAADGALLLSVGGGIREITSGHLL